MHCLKTTEAAALLDVAPSTLRAWERRFGFPMPHRSPGGHRAYAHAEVAALRTALRDGVSVAAAIVRARAMVAADSVSLVRALSAYDRERADRAMETMLALRSVERGIEEFLLPSLEMIVARNGIESATWAFSARWAADWLRRARRLTQPPARGCGVMLADASRDELDLDAPYIRALEVFCLRAGVKVIRLSAWAVSGIGDVAAVHRPNLVVLAGAQVDDEIVACWAQLIGRSVGPLPLALYRRAATRLCSTALPPAIGDAQQRLLELTGPATAAPVRQLAR